MLKRVNKADAGRVLLSLFLLVLVIIPLIRMFMNMSGDSLLKIILSNNFKTVVLNSIISAAITTVISVILAYFTAVCLERVENKLKGMFSIIFVLPMLIPSISHGMGLIILLGNNGILTRLLHLSGNIYGMQGIVAGSTLYSFPVAFLMLSDIMKYEDSSPHEAAKVLGISKVRQFSAITLPYLKKPLISVVFAIFTMVITDYGVPVMVGGKCSTIASVMYQEVIGQLDFGKGAAYGCFLLMPAVVAFIFDLLSKDRGNAGYNTKPFEPDDSFLSKASSYTFCAIMSVIIILPIVSFCILGFTTKYPSDLTVTIANAVKTIALKADKYLLNSLVIALMVSVIGVVVSFVTAYLTARMRSKVSKMLHLASITSAAIPGIVLGLSYVLVFKGSFIYGTITILVMVNLIHFFSSPYLMIYNSLSKMNENLEAVGHTLGVSRSHMIVDVFIPQSKGTLLEMFSYFFVNCMMTISAVSFLANTSNKPISLMINQFEAQMQLESAAVVSLAILAVNLVVKGVFSKLKNR